MKTYRAILGGGDLGDETIEARDLSSAWTKAVVWARAGVWNEGPAEVHLRVVGPDGEESGPVAVGRGKEASQ